MSVATGWKGKVDDYCNFCGLEETPELFFSETNSGLAICVVCADVLSFCETCGSIRREGEDADEQLHFEELCFK